MPGDVVQICYDMEWVGGGVVVKLGCAHKAPGAVATSASQNSALAPAGATWSLIDSPSDFLPSSIFNAQGLEPWDNRVPWRECDKFTAEGSAGRDICKAEAIGLIMDKDIPTLQAFAKIHMVRQPPGLWKVACDISQCTLRGPPS